jgi:hypothetical protein
LTSGNRGSTNHNKQCERKYLHLLLLFPSEDPENRAMPAATKSYKGWRS